MFTGLWGFRKVRDLRNHGTPKLKKHFQASLSGFRAFTGLGALGRFEILGALGGLRVFSGLWASRVLRALGFFGGLGVDRFELGVTHVNLKERNRSSGLWVWGFGFWG